jgi:hypothetical protein
MSSNSANYQHEKTKTLGNNFTDRLINIVCILKLIKSWTTLPFLIDAAADDSDASVGVVGGWGCWKDR